MIEIISYDPPEDYYEIRISKQTLRNYADDDQSGSAVQYHIDEYVNHIRRFLRAETKHYLTDQQCSMKKWKPEEPLLLKSRYDLLKDQS
jgi:hypothetical protein